MSQGWVWGLFLCKRVDPRLTLAMLLRESKLLEQKIGTPQCKWISKLLGYDFSIEYNKGRENRVANALSRQLELEGKISLVGITMWDPIWLQDLRTSYKTDLELSELCQKLQ